MTHKHSPTESFATALDNYLTVLAEAGKIHGYLINEANQRLHGRAITNPVTPKELQSAITRASKAWKSVNDSMPATVQAVKDAGYSAADLADFATLDMEGSFAAILPAATQSELKPSTPEEIRNRALDVACDFLGGALAKLNPLAAKIKKLLWTLPRSSQESGKGARQDGLDHVDENDLKILKEHAKYSHTLKIADLAAGNGMPSETTCKNRVNQLIEKGYLQRPSDRAGTGLTPNGRDFINK